MKFTPEIIITLVSLILDFLSGRKRKEKRHAKRRDKAQERLRESSSVYCRSEHDRAESYERSESEDVGRESDEDGIVPPAS